MKPNRPYFHLVFPLLFIGSVIAGFLTPSITPTVHAQSDAAQSEPAADSAASQLFLPLISNADATPPAGGELHEMSDYALAELARQRNEAPFIAPEARATGPLNQVGQWGATVTWPFVFASAANLPDGRIIAWGGNNPTSFSGGTNTYASVWNPATNQFQSVNHGSHSMFCAIPTLLEDGRVFVNGGDGTRERTSTFDFRSNSWTLQQNMSVGRWYNGAVALPNGKVFTMLGDPGNLYPELWTPNVGWSLLTGANLQSPVLNYPTVTEPKNWLPALNLAPNGQIFHSGHTPQMNYLDYTGNGSVTPVTIRNDWDISNAPTVMFDVGKLLKAGGGAKTNRAIVIDLNGALPTKTEIAPMNNVRVFHNFVMLPTGEVLAVGGNTSGTKFSDDGTVLEGEIWNPDNGTWRRVANLSVPRNYHSVALLMTDGRVWAGGGGLCNCTADHPNHQVYSPPYLFNGDGTLATRPTISAAPDLVTYNARFTVQASTNIQRFSMVKLSGVTHTLNSDQRYLRIPFTTVSSGQYQLTLPSNANVLTPGYWMLFAINDQGVPSVAKVIQISNSGAPRITPPGAQSTVLNNNVNLRILANDPNGDPLSYSASGLPTGLSIQPSTGLIAGTATQTGLYRTVITVSDGSNNSSVNFDWSVNQPGTIRFVKLVAESEVNGNPWSSAAELNLLTDNGQVINRAAWKISADSEETAGEDGRASNAIDGNSATIWHTQWQSANPPPPHWLLVDLGAAYNVTGFRYLPRQGGTLNGTIAAYKFYLSTDGVTWSAAVAQGTFANNSSEKSATVSANRLPALTNPGNKSNLISDTVSLPLTVSDADGDPLKFSAAGLPPGLTINTLTGVISGRPTTAGNFAPTIAAEDARGGIASISFQWSITSPSYTVNAIASAPKVSNSPVSYTASSNAVNPRYKWLFGDGSAESAYSASPTISHSFAQPGIYVGKLTVIDGTGVEKSINFSQAIYLPATANRPAASSNIAYEVRTAGNRLWAVNGDNDSVAVIDLNSNSRVAEIAVGKAPRSLAIAPNGRIWVTNKGSATVSIIDPTTLSVVQTLPLPVGSQPYGLVFAPTGNAAYLVLEAGGKLLRLDPASGAQNGSLEIGANVRHLAINSDGSKLYLSRFITPRVAGEATATPQLASANGELLVVNSSTLTLSKSIAVRSSDKPDAEAAGRGLPNYLGALALAPDGINSWLPSKQDNILRGSLRDGNNLNFQNTVRAISSRIDLSSDSEDYPARLDHDNAGVASSALFDRSGSYLFVALETNRAVAVIDSYGRRELFRVDVGRAPQGLAISPDGLRLYVNNLMDRSITVLDLSSLINEGKSTLPVLATVAAIGTEKLPAQVLAGKQFFYDARDPRLASDSYISCAACHNDGGEDGRVWDLTGFGEGLRNTISLQGHSGTQGFLHWSGNFDEVQDFEGQIRSLAGGTGLMNDALFNTGTRNQPLGDRKSGVSPELDALSAYVASLNQQAASPYRNADGTLTADGAAGKTIFQNANCAQCHGGVDFTSSGNATLFNIGTLKPSSGKRLNGPLVGIDPPTLRGAWATAPYLHDGSAATLAEAVRAHNNVSLSDADLSKVVAYLQQIDGNEPSAPAPVTTGQIQREWWSNISGWSVISLTRSLNFPNNPSGTQLLTSFEAPSNWAENFGSRIRGYLHPPVSGQYRFWIAGDDNAQLFLSSDEHPANALLIAGVPGWSNARQWNKYPEQQSVLITLEAGKRYYIEALHKEATGGDHLAVAWQPPGGTQTVISGNYLSPYQPPVAGNGQIGWQWWNGISGSSLSNLTTSANYPNNPSGSSRLSSFETPSNWADNYGTRLRGYLYAPVTGQYRFWIAGDDSCQLLLSTDNNASNARVIASLSGWTNPREWGKYSSQQSVLITLQAGQRYYIEALHKEGSGGDHLAVAWQIPGGVQNVIRGEYLAPQ